MFKVKTIGLIICIGALWGLITPGAACMKNGGRFATALTPPSQADSLSSATDSSTDTTHSYLALGDSYTIGQSVDLTECYPVQAVQLLKSAHLACQSPEIIAMTGWTTTDLLNVLASAPPVLTTVSPARPYGIVTLLIGVNDQFQGRSQAEYKDQFTSLLRQSITLAGNKTAHVLVLSIPDYSVTPFAHGHNTALIAAQIDSFNVINAQISADYQVHYLDVTADSRKAATDGSLLASDGLHFSGKEYAIWAKKMEPVMKEILK